MTGARGRQMRLGWSPADRLGLSVLLGVWALWLGWWAWRRPVELAEATGPERSWAKEVRERIDPNTASAASLRRLPLVGPVRAAAIVRHREASLRAEPGGRVFRRAEDLLDVPGVGEGTLRRMRPHLSLGAAATPVRRR